MAFFKRFIPLLSVLLLLVCLMAPCVFAAPVDDPVVILTADSFTFVQSGVDLGYGIMDVYSSSFSLSNTSDITTSTDYFYGAYFDNTYYRCLIEVSPAEIVFMFFSDSGLIAFGSLPGPDSSGFDSFSLFYFPSGFSLPSSIRVIDFGFSAPVDDPLSPDIPPAPGGPGLVDQLVDVSGSFLQTCIGIADKIVSTPLLLFTVGIFFLGGAVGIFGRILGRD